MIDVFCESSTLVEKAQSVASELQVKLNIANNDADYRLLFSEEGVELQNLRSKQKSLIKVDFHTGANDHRRKFGGGKGQPIAKAVGLKDATFQLTIFDATAGLGGDAFVLASLGAKMEMCERSPVAFALLEDGLQRASVYAQESDDQLNEILHNMSLSKANSLDVISQAEKGFVDVIYLDPMFPERKKSAAVKKGMQAFQTVIGIDEDESQLLAAALAKAKYRVVAKRPAKAPIIVGASPNYQLLGKSCRFDVYALRSLKAND